MPILIKSSESSLLLSYFFTIWATNLRLCSINLDLASLSPKLAFFIHSSSISIGNGSGKQLLE